MKQKYSFGSKSSYLHLPHVSFSTCTIKSYHSLNIKLSARSMSVAGWDITHAGAVLRTFISVFDNRISSAEIAREW